MINFDDVLMLALLNIEEKPVQHEKTFDQQEVDSDVAVLVAELVDEVASQEISDEIDRLAAQFNEITAVQRTPELHTGVDNLIALFDQSATTSGEPSEPEAVNHHTAECPVVEQNNPAGVDPRVETVSSGSPCKKHGLLCRFRNLFKRPTKRAKLIKQDEKLHRRKLDTDFLVSTIYDTRLEKQQQFLNILRTEKKPEKPWVGNPHGEVCAQRKAASLIIDKAVKTAGLKPYFLSKSNRDSEPDGQHSVYWPRDTQIVDQNDRLKSDHCMVAIDSLNYLDLPKLMKSNKPIVAYTLHPRCLSHASYGVNMYYDNGQYVQNVNGGTETREEVWKFNDDYYSAHSKSWIGTKKTNVYRCHEFQSSNHHSIVALLPHSVIKRNLLQRLVSKATGRLPVSESWRQPSRMKWEFDNTGWSYMELLTMKGDRTVHFMKNGTCTAYSISRTHLDMAMNAETHTPAYDVQNRFSIRALYSVNLCEFTRAVYSKKRTFVPVTEPMQSQLAWKTDLNGPSASLKDTVNDENDGHVPTGRKDMAGNTIQPETFDQVQEEVELEWEAIKSDIHLKRELNHSQKIDHVQHKNFTTITEYYDSLAPEKGKMKVVAPPITTHAAMCPSDTINNDVAGILIRTVQAQQEPKSMTPAIRSAFDKFLNCMKKYQHSVDLTTIEKVISTQNEPLQKVRNENYRQSPTNDKVKVKTFMKEEAYASAKKPRLISPFPVQYTLEGSRVSLPIVAALKKICPGYMSGRSPKEIARRVHKLGLKYKFIYSCDQESMDGHFQKLTRDLEKEGISFLLVKECIHFFQRLVEQEYRALCDMNRRVKYTGQFERFSGSWITTLGNTILMLFNLFYALIKSGMPAEEAFHQAMNAMGDDGIVGCNSPDLEKFLHETASELGFEIEVLRSDVTSSKPPNFLSRHFYNPWAGPESIGDPERWARKATMSSRPANEDDLIGFYLKCQGYLAACPTQPLISAYCKAAIKHMPKKIIAKAMDKEEKDLPYTLKEARKAGHEGEMWPEPAYEQAVVLTSKVSPWSCKAIKEFDSICNKATSLDDLFKKTACLLPTEPNYSVAARFPDGSTNYNDAVTCPKARAVKQQFTGKLAIMKKGQDVPKGFGNVKTEKKKKVQFLARKA